MKKVFTDEKEQQYYNYVMQHKSNVKKAFRLLREYLLDYFCSEELEALKKQIDKHDNSKLKKDEFLAYCEHFFQKKENPVYNFDYAWLHHQHNNPHHHQYWVLKDSNGVNRPLDMPKNHIVEMVCDWWSFSLMKNDYSEVLLWYENNRKYMLISKQTEIFVKKLLNIIKNNFVEVDR